MRVATIINPNAGQVSLDVVVSKIKKSLFRCELDFFTENNLLALEAFIEDQVQMEADAIVLVGGDGTINCVANIAMKIKLRGLPIPPICLVSLGTANDLAYELGIDIRLDRAVQALFSGKATPVDLLKVRAGGKDTFMFTNGGIGLTADTAKSVNRLRKGLRTFSQNSPLATQIVDKSLRFLGPNIYNVMLASKWLRWDHASEVEIVTNDGTRIQTRSPFVLVNNQKTLARRFYTAPATKNNDGLFNILILNKLNRFQQLKSVAMLGSGRWIQESDLISKEVSSITIRAISQKSGLTFLGDGEILHENVKDIAISCVHPGLEMISDRGSLQ